MNPKAAIRPWHPSLHQDPTTPRQDPWWAPPDRCVTPAFTAEAGEARGPSAPHPVCPQSLPEETPATATPDQGAQETETRKEATPSARESRSPAEEHLLKQLSQGVERLQLFGAALTRQAADLMSECVLQVAARVLRKKVQADRHWLLTNLQQALGRLPPNGKIKLRLHPADLQGLQRLSPRPTWLEGPWELMELTADGHLSRGDFVIESSRGRVDARLEGMLKSLQPVLVDMIQLALSGETSS